MSTEVIILAQGTQSRMGRDVGYKQLLPLPHCAGVPILVRTLMQIQSMFERSRISVVTWHDIMQALDAPCQNEPWRHVLRSTCVAASASVHHVELADPGNSSLKGIARYLENRGDLTANWTESTIVLLGDVVYSWACLASLRVMADRCGFVGTTNLSSSGGELWGVAWHRRHRDGMLAELRDALLRHPPFDDTYQPGQLRRWLVGWRRGDVSDAVTRLTHAGHYRPIDDYTMDVDLPQHIPLLEAASRAAAIDDEQHDLVWSRT